MALSVTHLHVRENLFSISIYNLVWFDDDATTNKPTSAPQLPPLNTPSARLSIVSRRYSTSSLPRARRGDVENQFPLNFNHDKPLPSSPSSTWWGGLLPGRAGRDHPFTIRRARDGVDIPNLPWSARDNLQYPSARLRPRARITILIIRGQMDGSNSGRHCHRHNMCLLRISDSHRTRLLGHPKTSRR